MWKTSKNVVLLCLTAAGAVVMVAGWWQPSVWLVFGGGIVLCYVLAQLLWLRQATE